MTTRNLETRVERLEARAPANSTPWVCRTFNPKEIGIENMDATIDAARRECAARGERLVARIIVPSRNAVRSGSDTHNDPQSNAPYTAGPSH